MLRQRHCRWGSPLSVGASAVVSRMPRRRVSSTIYSAELGRPNQCSYSCDRLGIDMTADGSCTGLRNRHWCPCSAISCPCSAVSWPWTRARSLRCHLSVKSVKCSLELLIYSYSSHQSLSISEKIPATMDTVNFKVKVFLLISPEIPSSSLWLF